MDKQNILNGTSFSLDEKNDVRFWLEYHKWNDYGYYTRYSLHIYAPNRILLRAGLHIMNIGQQTGCKPSWGSTPPIVFISSIASAEKLFLFLNPEQRANLEKFLSIRYDSCNVEREGAFKRSVLRDWPLTDFLRDQQKIKELMQCPLDVSSMIENHKSEL